jgi:hypothetical protein
VAQPVVTNRHRKEKDANRKGPTATLHPQDDGKHWSISFRYVDKSGPFPMPDEGEVDHNNLMTWLYQLNQHDWPEIIQTTREDGKPAHKPCEFTEMNTQATDRATFLIQTTIDPGLMDSGLFSFTYCLKRHDPRRLWVLKVGTVLYPVWWDLNHQVMGGEYYGKSTANAPCTEECIHPGRKTGTKNDAL